MAIGRVSSLFTYPLTGAQGNRTDRLAVDYTGPVGDRQYVLYDASKARGEKNRVSQKQYPKLACLKADFDEDANLIVTFPGESEPFTVVGMTGREVTVNEFGDETPAIDCGDEPAERFADYLQNPSIRLAEKAPGWMSGEEGAPLPADRRAVSPLHIIGSTSVHDLSSRVGHKIPASRFRPNIVIDNLTTAEEPELVGRTLLVGALAVVVTRLTVRCIVPGIDQRTGENRRDVPSVYRDYMREVDGQMKPTFGVYAVPVLQPESLAKRINHNDAVVLLDTNGNVV